MRASANSLCLSFRESRRAFCLISVIRRLAPGGQFVSFRRNPAFPPPLRSKQPTLNSKDFNGMLFRVKEINFSAAEHAPSPSPGAKLKVTFLSASEGS